MKKTITSLCVAIFFLTTPVFAQSQWRFQDPNVVHRPQPTDWSCGPTNIAMWAGAIRRQSLDIYQITNQCCGTNGTTIPEFMNGMFNWTPYGYVFSEWAYTDKEAAIKGIMWSVARFNQPAVFPGGNGIFGFGAGSHYILVRGGRADYNPYQQYGENNHIRGIYINDSTENSPVPKYRYGPVSGMYRSQEQMPSTVANYWPMIGASGDKKYRSIERNCYQCWQSQGATYYNRDSFTNF
jgi:hypothetical protein